MSTNKLKTFIGIWFLNDRQKESIRKLGARRFRTMHLPKGKKEKPKLEKRCPICGKERKSGYFKHCRGCGWIFEWRERLSPLLEQLKEIFKKKGAEFSWIFTGTIVHFSVDIWVKCLSSDISENNLESEKNQEPEKMGFGSNANLSLYEIDQLPDDRVKNLVVSTVTRLFELANDVLKESVDENGKCIKVGGVAFPVAGKWRDSDG